MTILNRNLKIITTINIIFVSANSFWIMFMPYFFKDSNLTAFEIGIIFGLGGVMNAIGRFVGGKLSTQIGTKYDMALGYTIYSLAPILFLTSFYISALPIGLFGSGIVAPAQSMFVVEQSGKRKGFTYMFVERFLPSLLPAVFLPIGAYLYYKNLFYFSLIIGFLGAISLIPLTFQLSDFKRESYEKSSDFKSSKIRQSVLMLSLIILIVAYSFDAFFSSVFSWYIPLFLQAKGYGVLFYGVFASLATIVIAFGSLISGQLVDKLNPYRALILSWITLSAIVLIFALVSNMTVIIITYLIWNTIDMVDTAAAPILIYEWFRKKRRIAYGYFSGSIKIASILGLLISGLIVSISPTFPFLLKSIANIIGAILIFTLYKFTTINKVIVKRLY